MTERFSGARIAAPGRSGEDIEGLHPFPPTTKPLDTTIAAYTRAWNEQRHSDCARIVKALWGGNRKSPPVTDETQRDYDEERRHGWALSEQFPQP